MTKTTNQITIECKNEKKGYDIFEEIQNRFKLFDNCCLDGNEKPDKPCFVRIEGIDLDEVTKLAKRILEKYYPKIKELKISIVPIEDTIIDDDRKEETGCLSV